MLTRNDLQKIGDLFDEKLEAKFEEKLAPIKSDVGSLKTDVGEIKKDIQTLKKNDKKIRKDLSLTLKYLDGERATHHKRITKIEDHPGLPPLDL